MFGRSQAPAGKSWGEMYFYEKVHHLVDHCASVLINKVDWWVPSVAVGIVLSVFLVAGPEGPMQGVGMVVPSVTPVVRVPSFASPEGTPQGGAPEEDEEF